MFLKKKPLPEYLDLKLDEKTTKITLKTHVRAKNYRLLIATNGKPTLTMPKYGNVKHAQEFLFKHKDWLKKRLKTQPKHIAFIDGAIIPFRNKNHQIIMLDNLRGLINIVENENGYFLEVPGGEEFMARRLKDWLKKQAKFDLEKAVKIHSTNLGVTYKSISIRSQSSRWGSCSSSKRLNFNWRLILAPSFVLDYVAAHEVAHLLEMNHSKAFWETVKTTLPDMENGKIWLKKNGNKLMAYG